MVGYKTFEWFPSHHS